jgi:hypothetical protein
VFGKGGERNYWLAPFSTNLARKSFFPVFGVPLVGTSHVTHILPLVSVYKKLNYY